MGGMGITHKGHKCVNRIVHIDENQFKNYVQIALTKLTILRNKIRLSQPEEKNQIINYLKQGRISSAKNKLKHYLQNEDLVFVYDHILQGLEILYEWSTYMLRLHHMFEEFKHIIILILWASCRIEISEFRNIREQLRLKYDEEFVNNAINNVDHVINESIVNKLDNWKVDIQTINFRLEEICREEELDINIDKDTFEGLLDEDVVSHGDYKINNNTETTWLDEKNIGVCNDNINFNQLLNVQPAHHR